jgi:hypothetical protein
MIPHTITLILPISGLLGFSMTIYFVYLNSVELQKGCHTYQLVLLNYHCDRLFFNMK